MNRGAGRPPSGAATALGAVLAGGSGSRLGGAKPTAELAGRPLISFPLAALAAAGLEAVVVAKPDTELPDFGAPGWAGEGEETPAPRLILEPREPRHPLAGIVAALRDAGTRPLVVLACDMPLASPALLAALAAAPDPLVVPSPGGLLEPLQARYSASLLASLEAALAERAPLRQTVAALGPRLLGEAELSRFGPVERSFLNVNDAADLARAEELLGG
ncbi:MAG: NTP transferase domain-containing protein [Solirubrobacterales bacterium]